MKFKASQFGIITTTACCIFTLCSCTLFNQNKKYINTGIKTDSLTTEQLLNWDSRKDTTVKYYKNVIPLQKPVMLQSLNESPIPSVMGEMNYDSYNGANSKVIGNTYSENRSIFLGWNYINS